MRNRKPEKTGRWTRERAGKRRPPSPQIGRAGLRRRAGHHTEKVANSSPFPCSESQATDFDQNKTALTRVHYSKTSVELARGSLWLGELRCPWEGARAPPRVGSAWPWPEMQGWRGDQRIFFLFGQLHHQINLISYTQEWASGAPGLGSWDCPFQFTHS